ncbi:MAG: DUF72 domain-containing protein [Promethearchaeota archaeon]
MRKISIGCAGWDYIDWIGPFYPKKLKKSYHLTYYAKFFNIVEINSTFYNLPSIDTVSKWNSRVSTNFRFIIKIWKNITHNLDDSEIESRIIQFLYHMEPLKKKTAAFLLQFPPWFNYSEKHLNQLKFLLNNIPNTFKLVIELRDNSWFEPEILSKFIDGSHKILGTTYMPKLNPYYLPFQNYYYIRLIGDRKLTVFNQIQRDQKESLAHLKKEIKNLISMPNIFEIFIIVNNHFAGFAPETVNILKKELVLEFQDFNKQKRIFDYLK